jgi:selenocysteine lyase/cysteine desulfurase
MTNLASKQQYAQAVLSGSMTKVAAFTKFINPQHSNPSQGAYRLENTQHMRKLMDDTREELARTDSIRRKQLLITERSLDILNRLLDGCEQKTSQEQLATLRLVKSLARNIEDGPLATDGGDASPSENLDRTGLIS